tara:strand:+ start:2694 stop:3077 length:384 start_codon:yes stop_codon:yes gene_type:complete
MEMTSKIENNIFTIKLLESLHLHNAQDFKYFFNARVEKSFDIIIDLSSVHYIDEIGIACLFYCHEVAFMHDSKLFIHKPMGEVKKIMQIMNCYESFEIIDHKNLNVFYDDQENVLGEKAKYNSLKVA